MNKPIDWHHLAEQIGTLHETGESGSDEEAYRALRLIIGEDQFRAAVDYAITRAPGFALARAVLRILQPWTAVQRCYELYHSKEDIYTKRAVVWLLSDIADPRTLDWVEEFLDDADAEIQAWGIHLLNELARSALGLPEETEILLSKAEQHANSHVRERVVEIRTYLKNRVSATS